MDLSENELSKPHGQALARILAVNESLTTLKLGWNKFGNDGSKCIANGLTVNTRLRSIVLCLVLALAAQCSAFVIGVGPVSGPARQVSSVSMFSGAKKAAPKAAKKAAAKKPAFSFGAPKKAPEPEKKGPLSGFTFGATSTKTAPKEVSSAHLIRTPTRSKGPSRDLMWCSRSVH